MKKLIFSLVLIIALSLALLVFPASATETQGAEHQSHCVCGGTLSEHAITASGHACENSISWEAWGDTEEEKNALPTSGYYYLYDDITVACGTSVPTGAAIITKGNQLTLCLNGHTISTQARTFDVKAGASLTLTDCQDTGRVDGNTARKTSTTSVCFIRDGGTFNIYGGILNAANASPLTGACGSVYVSTSSANGDAVLNMYGGTITNGRGQSCGNLYIDGVMNMYGGTVSNGSSAADGGNMAIVNGELNFVNGLITGGSATRYGGNIWSKSPITLGAGEISNGKAQDGGNLFTNDSGNITLNGTIFTGGEATNNGGSISAGGTFYLNNNASITGGQAGGNGGNIYARRSVNLNSGSVCDGYAGGNGGNIYGMRYGSKTTNNTTVTNTSSPTIKLAGATVSNGEAAGNGGNIYGECTITVASGTITNGRAANGGNIYIMSSDQVTTQKDADNNILSTTTAAVLNTMNVNGGLITLGNAENGGNIHVENCTLKVTAGVISNGTALYNGGNISTNGSLGTISISDATICDGTAYNDGGTTSTYGGNIYLKTKTVTITNTAITGGQASHGGNIELTGTASNVTITGCNISGGSAIFSCGPSANVGNGGNIHISNGANLTLKDDSISTGEAYRGGNISAFAHVTVENCTIFNGSAKTGGGNIFSYNYGKVTIDSATTISGGSCENIGGNVTVSYGGEVILNGTTVSDGAAAQKGGNIAVESHDANNNPSVCTLNAATITNGIALNGNDISVTTDAICNISDSTIFSDTNTADYMVWIDTTGTVNLKDSTITNNGAEGSAICIRGKLVLQGAVNMSHSANEAGTFDTLDIFLDTQNNSGATLDITELTGQDAPFVIGLLTDDGITGCIAQNATQAQAKMFQAHQAGYGIYFTADSLYLTASAVQGMDGNTVVSGYDTLDEALAAADTAAKYFVLNANLDGQTVSKDATVDLNGNQLTNIHVLQGVTLQLADSTTVACDDRFGTMTGTVEGTIPSFVTMNGKNYMTVEENGTYSSHYFTVKLTHVSMIPSQDSLGYKAKVVGDSTVMSHVTAFGFHLWVNEENVLSFTKTEDITNILALRLRNILSSGNGETDVYGNAFATFTVNGESVNVTCQDYCTSLRKTIEAVNDALKADRAAYTEEQVYALQDLLNKYEATKTWNTNAILDWIPESDTLVQEIAADSMVLLKNENQVLPLAKNTKINLFGYNTTDLGFLLTGGGSGSTRTTGDKSITLLEAFREAGVDVNMDLYAQYAAWDNLDLDSNDSSSAPQCILSNPGEDFYTDALMEQAKAYSDTAVVVISRWGRENGTVKDAGVSHSEIPFIQVKSGMATDTSRTYLQISTEEELMLRKVTENFDNVIVLLNLCNTMELGFLDDAGIDAAMFIGMPGQSGSHAIPRLLFGDITPSGKLADVYPYNHKADPTWANALVDRSNSSNKQIVYQEGIYYGYRWYETAFADGIQISANGYAQDFSTEEGYRKIVQFPFGFGLSYTNFSWELVEAPASGTAMGSSTDSFTVKVKVTNTGNAAGKEIVQLYANPPYTPGGIEKAALTLVDFAKTDTLQPGQSQVLTLSFTAYDLAAYDCYDANQNGFAGYELEAGKYTLTLMTDSHTATQLRFTLQAAQNILVQTDPVTGEAVENRFTGESAYGSAADGGANYMSRTDFATTFPTQRATGTKTTTVSASYEGELKTVVYGQDNGLYLVTLEDGSKATLADLTGESDKPLIWNKDLLLQLQNYDDPIWEQFLNQITKEETMAMIKDGGFKITAAESLGLIETEESDGPSGLSRVASEDRTAWPAESLSACSWNEELLYEMGRAVGMEAKAADIQGWYAPGVNLHRSAYSSRNFEYYSEDPVLSGKLGAQVIRGAKQEGLICFLKHFAVSEAGKNPSQVSTWLTEQTMREIYLKAFEIAVKDGDANGIMSAFNAIGDVYCGHNPALLQDILRTEWGFRGQVITDWWGEYMGIHECVLAGNDKMLLRRETTQQVDLSDTSSQIANAARQSVKNIIYSLVDSCVTGGFYEEVVDNQDVEDATDEGAAGEQTP